MAEIFNYPSFIKYIQHDNSVNIRYVRKSKTQEATGKRVDLLQKMMDHLRAKSLCRKVFVSPSSNANDPLIQRDEKLKPSMQATLQRLRHINGDCQDLITELQTARSPLRLIVQDFTGLSTVQDDIRLLVE
ncbi:unnamed protein product [Rhizopus microsporus]